MLQLDSCDNFDERREIRASIREVRAQIRGRIINYHYQNLSKCFILLRKYFNFGPYHSQALTVIQEKSW